MQFSALGINHKTCPIEIRERFYLNTTERELFLSEIKSMPEVGEALIISTCNRTEVYALILAGHENLLLEKICAIKKQPLSPQVRRHFYFHQNEKAVTHLLNVSAGLDSLVVGEKEILGQIKDAIELARRKRTLGRFFNILANTALRTGKLARSSTGISRGGVSVSWAAVERAKNHLGTLKGSSILIIGAGKMSHLAAADLTRKGLEHLYIINRTKEKGDELANKFNGIATDFSDIKEILANVDVCICSAGAPHYLLEKALIQECMRERTKGLLLIDISMPRNIDPRASRVNNVTLVGIDELDEVVAANVKQRQDAVAEVEKLVDRKQDEFYRKLAASCMASKNNQSTRVLAGISKAGL